LATDNEDTTDQPAALRRALVDGLTNAKWITRPRVEAAFRAVPRHLFLLDVSLEDVYRNKAIVTKTDDSVPVSSSSQPAIMAVMLEQLGLGEGDNVLEIGTGTGYNAALISNLVGPNGHVTTVDIDADIVAFSQQNLQRAGIGNVEAVHADGGFGYLANAPYDALISTVGVWDLSPHWTAQLREAGRLVAPLSFNTLQFSIGFEKNAQSLISGSIRPCGFMRLRGAYAGPETYFQVDGLTVGVEDPARIDMEHLRRLLGDPPRDCALSQSPSIGGRSLIAYVALCGETLLTIADGERKRFGSEYALGLMTGDSSLLVLSFDPDNWQHVLPVAHIFGTASALDRFEQLIEEWEDRGSPELVRATITAAPLDLLGSRTASFLIRKRWMEYEINFGTTPAA
jgi:methyltransferase of FxLD system